MSDKYLKISQLARLLNDTLEMYVGESFFEGELHEMTKASSGHLYCTIKDEQSSLSIVLWASTVRGLKFTPERGLLVRCQGKPSIYNKTGRLQIVVSKMELAGEGALQQKFEELKLKLTAEGLFLPERKRKLPFLPRAIGIVTSAQGAVVHDIMTRLKDRMPHIPVFLVDVRVQGEGAAQEIASAIKFLSESDKVDVIIAGRGGGSLQDLWPFNEEIVVRAIFASKVPVISAVGHEVDLTLADFVADVRAPTPTAAAEIVVPRKQDLQRILLELDRRLSDFSRWLMPKAQELDELGFFLDRAINSRFSELRLKFEVVSGRLKLLSPQNLIELLFQKLKGQEDKLSSALKLRIQDRKRSLDLLEARLSPNRKIESLKLYVETLKRIEFKLKSAALLSFEQKKNALIKSDARLQALSPKSILQRGFSITRMNNDVVSSISQVKSGQSIAIELKDGSIEAQID